MRICPDIDRKWIEYTTYEAKIKDNAPDEIKKMQEKYEKESIEEDKRSLRGLFVNGKQKKSLP